MVGMGAGRRPRRRTYKALGEFLKAARQDLRDPDTGRILRVEQVAEFLGVTPSFVYQVEQGNRKPEGGYFGRWASVYGVTYTDMWKCMDSIPMDLVATMREEADEPAPADSYSHLTEAEKTELLPFAEYVRWKVARQASESGSLEDSTG